MKSLDKAGDVSTKNPTTLTKICSSPAILWAILLTILFFGFIGTAFTPPLTNVHWDSPIHLYEGKRYAQTALLADYAESAHSIAAKVEGTTVIDGSFWSPYWHFVRLGHTMLVGSVISANGTNETTIIALQWLFSGLVSIAVFLSAASACNLARLLDLPLAQDRVLLGSTISAALFVLSDIYGYLGRSLVSETPALLLMAAAILSFLMGQQRRSLVWPAFSGILAFSFYLVRADAIWPYLSLLLVLAAAQWKYSFSSFYRQGYVIALITSLACWLAYLAWMYPLPSPLLFIAFSKLSDVDPGEVSLFRLTEAIGLLLIGISLSLAVKGSKRISAILMIGAALGLLPAISHMLAERSVQTRMFVPYIFFPSFFASTFGWAKLFSHQSSANKLAVIFVTLSTGLIVAASAPVVYEHVFALPGLWRIQSINNALKPLLLLPAYEKKTYVLSESREAAEEIMSLGYKIPIVGGEGVRAGDLYLIDYFMTAYTSNARLVMNGEPVFKGNCPITPRRFEQHSFCFGMTRNNQDDLIKKSNGIFLIERASGKSVNAEFNQMMPSALVYTGTQIRVRYVSNQRNYQK